MSKRMEQFVTPRERELNALHGVWVKGPDHDGASHCGCDVAVELRALTAERWRQYDAKYKKYRIPEGVADTRLSKAIYGAIVSAIHAHGPIAGENIGSAVKRIVGAVKALQGEKRS